MNIKNNKRRQASREKIEKAFVQLLQKNDVNQISVTDICNLANVNRTTFYANYIDIFDLIEKIGERILQDFHSVYEYEESNNYNSNDFLKLFLHIKENQLFYKTYFKLGLDNHLINIQYDTSLAEQLYNNMHIEYHIEFFKAGITAIIKKWLNNDCDIEPEVLSQIMKDEYLNKQHLISDTLHIG